MSSYYLGSGISYHEYLQKQAFVDDIKKSIGQERKQLSYTIQSSTREIIATQESLITHNINLERSVREGFDELSFEFDELKNALSYSLDVLNSTFQWGLHRILSQLGKMSETLEEILNTLKSPTKSKAYEYFDDARNAFARGHHADALELIEKAINGDHTSTGYKLDWRFYFLKASILIGTVEHPELLDLPAAEYTYKKALEYAETEDSKGASMALLGASWACYCQNKLDEALSLSKRAINFDPSSGEAYFQTAKILMAMNKPEESVKYISQAFDKDPLYLIKSASDGDFQSHNDFYEDWLKNYKVIKEKELKNAYSEVSEDERFWIWTSSKLIIEGEEEEKGHWMWLSEGKINYSDLEKPFTLKNPGLFDILVALKIISDFKNDLKQNQILKPEDYSNDLIQFKPYTVEFALLILSRVPSGLPLPKKLTEKLISKSNQWKLKINKWELNRSFFNFILFLFNRKEYDIIQKIFQNYPFENLNPKEIPLEFFVAWLNSCPNDPDAITKLIKWLQFKGSSSRYKLIYELEEIDGLKLYNYDSIQIVKDIIIKKWDEWRNEIYEELKKKAYEGTEPPFDTDIIGFFIYSFIGFLILGWIIEAITNSALGFIVWILGVLLSTFLPVVKRMNIRERKLSIEIEKDKKEYDRLKKIGERNNFNN